jgi:hypothetical protein
MDNAASSAQRRNLVGLDMGAPGKVSDDGDAECAPVCGRRMSAAARAHAQPFYTHVGVPFHAGQAFGARVTALTLGAAFGRLATLRLAASG